MSSLIRSQRRLAVIGLRLAIALLLFEVALLGAVTPRFSAIRVVELPLPWLLLGGAGPPVLIALAAYTLRQAGQNEQAFTELSLRAPVSARDTRRSPPSPSSRVATAGGRHVQACAGRARPATSTSPRGR